MTSTADRAINALRTGHETLAEVVGNLSPDQVTTPSAASQWSIADVLSHLGSGAEIGLATLQGSVGDADKPADGFNQSVWDRWNAKAPKDQASDFVTSNEVLVEAYEDLDEQTRNTARIDLGFLPEPVDVATSAAFRLNEFALHSWDVRVASDPAAVVAAEAVVDLLDVNPYLFGWLGRPGSVLEGREEWVDVTLTDPDRRFGLKITDKVEITDVPDAPTATLTLAAESWLRLVSGRLAPEHTPSSAEATGAVTLDQLRQIFPGY